MPTCPRTLSPLSCTHNRRSVRQWASIHHMSTINHRINHRNREKIWHLTILSVPKDEGLNAHTLLYLVGRRSIVDPCVDPSSTIDHLSSKSHTMCCL
jgi:hypothetical protein